jgi:hypothetical protein
MSKASEVVLDLVTRPQSSAQILARREAERPRTGLVGTLDGQWAEPASTSTQVAKPVMRAAPQTID